MKRVATSCALAVVTLCACGGAPSNAHPRGAGAPLAAPRVTAGQIDARATLGDVPTRATSLGAGPVAVVASGELIEGERIGAFVEAPADSCLLAYARGASSIDDLDLAAFSDDGTPVAVDEGPDPRPTLLICPPHPDRVYVAAHAAAGEGFATVGAQLVPRERAVDIVRGIGARGALGGAPRRPEAWPGLDDAVRARRAALGGTWEEVQRVAIPIDARAPGFVTITAAPDECIDALIVPDDDVALVDVEALDADAHVIARPREGSEARAVTVCSALAFEGAISVRPHVGRGLAAVVVSRARGDVARDLSQKPAVAWSATLLTVEKARAALDVDLAHAGYGAPTAAKSGALVIGRRVLLPIDLAADKACARVDIVAGAPLARIEARITDAGALVSTAEGASSATLFACGRAHADIDLEARGRGGPFAITVRKEPWQNAAFVLHPLAASRALARLAGGVARVFDGAPSDVHGIAIDTGHVTAIDRVIPAGKCVSFAVGVEGEGTGVELRVFDAQTYDELDRSASARDARARACAPADKDRATKVEITATSGKLDAVLIERVTPSG